MNEEEKRKYEAFQYWIQTNTEKGVTTIPDTLCLFVVNLIKSLQKENEKLKNKLLDTLEGQKVIKEETPQYIKENYIPKQKVREMRDELDRTKAEYMEWQKQELEQKDKIIDLMAEDIDGFQMECNRYFKDKEEVKQYFINKAKEIR